MQASCYSIRFGGGLLGAVIGNHASWYPLLYLHHILLSDFYPIMSVDLKVVRLFYWTLASTSHSHFHFHSCPPSYPNTHPRPYPCPIPIPIPIPDPIPIPVLTPYPSSLLPPSLSFLAPRGNSMQWRAVGLGTHISSGRFCQRLSSIPPRHTMALLVRTHHTTFLLSILFYSIPFNSIQFFFSICAFFCFLPSSFFSPLFILSFLILLLHHLYCLYLITISL